jgi:hypothetical protein
MQIENSSMTDKQLRSLDEGQLVAQELVQQGAIHALSTLLTLGCREETAHQMLASLRDNADRIRGEAARRGKVSVFSVDQSAITLN